MTFNNVDTPSYGGTVTDPEVVSQLQRILHNDSQSEVQISAGRNLKAALIRQWGQFNAQYGLKDIDSHYYQKNQAASKKMDVDFKRTYFGILNRSEIDQKLKLAAPELKEALPTDTSGSTFIIKDESGVACRTKGSQPGLLTVNVANFCVRRGQLISGSEFPADGLFSQKGCNNGTIHTITKISCVYYHPLCNRKVCAPGEVMRGPSATAETLWSHVSSHPGGESLASSATDAGSR